MDGIRKDSEVSVSALRTARSSAQRRRTFGERSAVARTLLASAVGRATGRLSISPVLRWRHGHAAPDQVLILPRDLRTADLSFASELLSGTFGLSCGSVPVEEERPFDVQPATPAIQSELHGFGWLRHLTASAEPEARDLGAGLIGSWISSHAALRDQEIWQTGITARRTLSWLAHGAPLLEEVEPRVYDRWLQVLGHHLGHLSATWSAGQDGAPRLLAAIARVAGDVCVSGRERYLARSASDLARELSRQIDNDGCHLSRDGDVLVELLLDLLPVQHCARARDVDLPASIAETTRRMISMVRHLRLGGTGLARFHGAGRSGIDAVTTVLGHAADTEDPSSPAPRGGYLRLDAGKTSLVLDAGGLPPVTFAGYAHASALAFELEIDRIPVFVNRGPCLSDDAMGQVAARSTASHSTLELAERSSAMVISSPALERIAGAPPLVMNGSVRGVGEATDDCLRLDAQHEGYLDSTGLVHRRRIELSKTGSELRGTDTLTGPRGATVRLKNDLPFAIRFHLGSDVGVIDGPWPDGVVLGLANGQTWQFVTAGAARLSLEDSERHDGLRVVLGIQIVLRGSTFGETEVSWRLTRR